MSSGAGRKSLQWHRVLPALLLTPPLLLLLTATSFMAAYALGAIPPTNVPGLSPEGYDEAYFAGVLGMLVGSSVSLWLGAINANDGAVIAAKSVITLWERGHVARAGWLGASLAPTAALFIIVRQYTYDAYYFPTHRRIADGFLSEGWLLGLTFAALISSFVTLARPVAGYVWTSVVLVVSLLLAVLQNAGH